MKTYTGQNSGAGPQKVTVKEVTLIRRDTTKTEEEVTLIGRDTTKTKEYELPLKPSLKLFNHSPDGFQWGYQGSGCAQLALAILLDLTEDPELSVRLHQEFKRHLIATAGKYLVITEPEIRAWLLIRKKERL